MKIYVVSCYDVDIFYGSSYNQVLNFLEQVRVDERSGVNDDTIIDVWLDYIDEYFSENSKHLGRKPLIEFLKDCEYED